jgi:hypothetical protein
MGEPAPSRNSDKQPRAKYYCYKISPVTKMHHSWTPAGDPAFHIIKFLQSLHNVSIL